MLQQSECAWSEEWWRARGDRAIAARIVTTHALLRNTQERLQLRAQVLLKKLEETRSFNAARAAKIRELDSASAAQTQLRSLNDRLAECIRAERRLARRFERFGTQIDRRFPA